ncbi:LysR family transcriptional regulator [Clostridium autoethanogenum]|uniref:LysR family transcriptional regulator n=2 Tax=Clostridium autoethanogenum TaxID=84023 RepID=A0A3M0SXL3_9CLOT|nr:LysR family transcriptional regulator [Clostridium autoethanogenum]AGY74864.1 LysR family transcriptional regulator [Clostridium autoethanogenum DSM 10061]ALU35041.1 Transcriptional regulator LysR family [Clostridium autoethanogenum DSM 10061]OVY49460.1 HTH-type transcriptional regulator CynR [Clostridium autoethanogenum]RMD03133.1 LysR family transcriptional regulator [Clostridium autoethanogenum]
MIKGSFSKAAKNLYISQPALSAYIKKIEVELGVSLFDRSMTPIHLTEPGEMYIHAILQVKAIQNNLEQYFQDITNLKVGKVSIGGTNFFCSCVLSDIIFEFKKQHPGINVDLFEVKSPDMHEELMKETIDLAIECFHLDTKLFENRVIAKENIILAVPKNYRINDELSAYRLSFQNIVEKRHLSSDFPPVQLSKFANQPFVMLRKGNDMYTRSMKMCRKAGFTPKAVIYLDQLMTSYHIARKGMGIAFIRDSLVKYMNFNEDICFYKLADELSSRELVLIRKKNRYLSRSVDAFINSVISFFSM